MTTRVRLGALVAFVGAFVTLGGLLALAFAIKVPGAWPRVRGVMGAGIALVVGISMISSAFTGRLPRWLSWLSGGGDRDDEI